MPFRFDTHALFFSDDAVALETALHQRLSHRRVNLVNPRREFFYATPAEVKQLLIGLGDNHVLEYSDTADAVEWRASDPGRRNSPTAPPSRTTPPRPAVLTGVSARTDVGTDGDLSDDGED